MRASLFTAVVASALLAAPAARAVGDKQPSATTPAAAKSAPSLPATAPHAAETAQPAPHDTAGSVGAAQQPPEDAGPLDGDGQDDDATDEVQAEDAIGIQEDVNAGKKELEELEKAESQAIPDIDNLPHHLGRMGPGNPLQSRIFDSSHRAGETYDVPAVPTLGDAGGLLAELGGLDLGALKAEYDIPIEINADVIEYIRFFQGPGRKWYMHWLQRSKRWIPIMRPILAEEGVPLDLVYLAMIESGFSPYAYSWARASGFWQFVSGTGRRFGLRDDFWVDERRDPILSTRAAARYLKQLHDEFGDWYLAWASYNAGEGKIRKAIKVYNSHDFWEIAHAGRFLRKETKHYVPKLIAAALIAKHPERFGFTDIVPEGPFTYDEVEIPDATDLHVIAKVAGISVDEVQQMNPQLRRWCTPPAHSGVGYKIKLPAGAKPAFLAEFAKLPEDRLTFRHHRVSRGESIAVLSRKFRTSGEAILTMNGIDSARHVRAGMDLIVPMSMEIAQDIPDSGATWTDPTIHSRHGRHRHTRWAAREARWSVERADHPAKHAKIAAKGNARYVIRSGDTLWSIAHRFGVEVAALRRWNGMAKNPKLHVGHAIYIAAPGHSKPARTASVRTRKGRG